MNVIISNKFESVLSTLDVEVIKSMNGEFEVEEIIDTFSNFYFQRMILDITSVKNYQDINKLQKLTINLDMDKVILVLDGSPESLSSNYLSKIISMGIYNFTTNKDGILYLLQHPNQYRDVAHLHDVNGSEDDGIFSGEQKTAQGTNTASTVTNTVTNTETVYLKNKIIGVKNITDHAGSSTLIYLIKKQLEGKVKVACIEVDGNDFTYFNDKDMISCTSSDFGKVLMNYSNMDVILVDLKNDDLDDNCKDMLYLIEPSIVKMNKIVKRDRAIFDKLKSKKVVLNRSTISSKDVLDFEYETKLRVFQNIPCLNDRKNNHESITELINKLGIM